MAPTEPDGDKHYPLRPDRTPDDDVRDMDELEEAGKKPEPPVEKMPDEPEHLATGEKIVLPDASATPAPAIDLPEEKPYRAREKSFTFATDEEGRTYSLPSFEADTGDSGLREAAELLKDAARMLMESNQQKQQQTPLSEVGEDAPDWMDDVADQLEETHAEMRAAAEEMVSDLRESWHNFAAIKRALETQRY